MENAPQSTPDGVAFGLATEDGSEDGSGGRLRIRKAL